MNKIAIVIPTYNEKDNIKELVKTLNDLPIRDFIILIIDDNSPDGTGVIADELSKKFPVTVLHRTEKSGAGSAFIFGFTHLLNLPEIEIPHHIIQMDGDFSHQPKDILNLLRAMNHCDIAVGSRYVVGGTTEEKNLFRIAVSQMGNIYTRVLLNLPYRDITSGFKCYTRNVLSKIDISTLHPIGSAFQVETLYRAHQKGFKICEIPISFKKRRFGKSKLTLRMVFMIFISIFKFRFRRNTSVIE